MKYQPLLQPIPQLHREELNQKILALIDLPQLPDGITMEDVYQGYTGVGGLHGLERKDFENFHEFTEAKKEIEQGQFFTPNALIEQIRELLSPDMNDTICDLTCGAGAFFNHFIEKNCHGCDIDAKAVKVAKFLYPEAEIQLKDIRYYEPKMHFDFVIGNPPFNLRWDARIHGVKDNYLSQHYFCAKAAELLHPGGILCMVVPDSFLNDEFFNKSMINDLNEDYYFLFQYKLDTTAFKAVGVESFPTKVMCFMRRAEALDGAMGGWAYKTTYSDYAEAKEAYSIALGHRKPVKVKILAQRRTIELASFDFWYKVKKMLYEIKTHKVLREYHKKALAHVHRYRTQEKPENMSEQEWEKTRLTENKVLAYLRRIVKTQNYKPVDKIRLVNDEYGMKLKAYSDKAQAELNQRKEQKKWSFVELTTSEHAPDIWQDIPYITKGQKNLLWRKHMAYLRQTKRFAEMGCPEDVTTYLKRFAFRNPKGEVCRLNGIQKEDLGRMLQKRYGILNWQQGSGKTAGATAWINFDKTVHNTFVVGPALAINTTWVKHMKVHGKEFINIREFKDIQKLKPGVFVLCGLEMLVMYERHIKRYIKLQNHKINFVFDESDEITNNNAKRTKAALSCFRKAKRKLLTTGTTTRNNITELYSQFELLYNNSVNMMCWAQSVWTQDRETGDLNEHSNAYYGYPFPPYGGQELFKRCFNPAKATVFGINKHNQDLYNEEHLRKLLEYTILTRKFKEVAGDKYVVKTATCYQNHAEREVYRVIIEELNIILPQYYQSTGNSRKDSMLRILRQLQLLIDATSMPQTFKQYDSTEMPGKASAILSKLHEWRDEKVAIGCTSLAGVEYYQKEVQRLFPGRSVFTVVGDVSFKKRDQIRAVFESTHNGVLISTQQSLKSSVNIPSCNKVIIESKQWNIPKIEQYYFRFIRYDSKDLTEVWFFNYAETIEMNLMALLLSKERLNDYIKTLEYKQDSDIYNEYDVDLDILNSIITKEYDSEGKVKISWGSAKLVA